MTGGKIQDLITSTRLQKWAKRMQNMPPVWLPLQWWNWLNTPFDYHGLQTLFLNDFLNFVVFWALKTLLCPALRSPSPSLPHGKNSDAYSPLAMGSLLWNPDKPTRTVAPDHLLTLFSHVSCDERGLFSVYPANDTWHPSIFVWESKTCLVLLSSLLHK